MIPAADQPTVVTLPDGKKAVLSLKILEGGEPTPLPMVPPPPRLLVKTASSSPPAPAPAPTPAAAPVSVEDIGGRITAFVLCYGDYPDMHRRCLSAIERTTRPDQVDLRVYLNQVCRETSDLVDRMHANGRVQVVYRSTENRRKYPAMREMFHDPNHPITTKWLAWFDDDSMCDVDPKWFDKMVSALHSASSKDPQLGMMGSKFYYKMAPKHAAWVRDGTWYTGRPFRNKSAAEAPNGDCIHFLTGGFWVMKTECIAKCDIPDPRLVHNGGDVCIGEQIYQQGYTAKHWNGDKRTVLWSSKPRRGISESIFGI